MRARMFLLGVLIGALLTGGILLSSADQRRPRPRVFRLLAPLSLISPSVDSLFQPPILKTQAHLAPPSMPKSKSKHAKGQLSVIPRIEHLLTEQTSVILQAVDEKISAQDQKIESRFAALDQHLEERLLAQDIRIVAAVDKGLAKMEQRFAKSLDDLTKTLDKFLKRLTDIEDEFTFMKEDLKRVKAVLREKLGVSLD